MKSKRNEVATITLCKLKLKKYILYLTLSIDMSLYQEGCYIDCQQSLMLNKKPKYSSEMSETQWPHTLHISLNQEKPDGPVWTDELQWRVFKYRMFQFSKPDISDFYWLVFNG
jgi:hypothetical protein